MIDCYGGRTGAARRLSPGVPLGSLADGQELMGLCIEEVPWIVVEGMVTELQ